ncbi:MAG: alpha/beta fold hydrolase [Pseudomonadota bacterium]
MRVIIVLILSLVAVASCAPRNVAKTAPPAADAQIVPVWVATHRALDTTGPAFGVKRSEKMSYLRVDVSVPSTHKPGQIEWPGPYAAPDAATDFVLTGSQVLPDARALVRALPHPGPVRETLVFVHGYNVTLSDGLYRLAQMAHDFEMPNPPVLFSWQSAGDARGYIYDRDSVLYARDDLETFLQQLTRTANDRVVLVAHSMGSQLVMETMRQMALKGDRRTLSRIDGVVLMSPDIDTDVFLRQARSIGELPQPFLIFVSSNDRILGLSSVLTGRKERLGLLNSPEEVEGLDVSILDFSELSGGAETSHDVASTSPAAISVLEGMLQQARSGEDAFENYMVLTEQPQQGGGLLPGGGGLLPGF